MDMEMALRLYFSTPELPWIPKNTVMLVILNCSPKHQDKCLPLRYVFCQINERL